MIRVLQIVSSMNIGGIETFIMNVYRNIDRNKVQFDFLVTATEKCVYDDEIEALGGKIYRVSSRRKGILKNWNELNNFFEVHNYECVHCHTSSPSYMEPLIVAKRAGVKKIIIHSHSSKGPSNLCHRLIRTFYRPKIKRFSNIYFACSRVAADWMYGQYVSSNNITIIPNGIETDKFIFNEYARKNIREELKIEDKFVIGHVGRFAYPKNHEFLIDIFKAIHDKKPNSVLVLVGDGELRNEIENKCRRLGMNDCVIFTGTRLDIPDILQALDVFVMPSRYEGLPVTLVEAQAVGLPCVISNRITSEIELTNLVKFVQLDSSINQWRDEIITKEKTNDRKRYSGIIKKSKFDISEVCKNLQEVYMK